MTSKLYVYKSGRVFDHARHFADLSHEDFIKDYMKDHPSLTRKDLTFAAERPEDWPGVVGNPMDFVVFVTVHPTKDNFVNAKFTSRVGGYLTLERCHLAIREDLKAMGETYGGLIPPVSTKGREYHIYQALGWTEHPV